MDNKNENIIPLTEQSISNDIIQYVNTFQLLEREDKEFLAKNKEHLGKVMMNTFMWRTDFQKRSIISDNYHPTLHSKFHQAILEQKVQFTEAVRLAKDFELKKIEIEKLRLDLEELKDDNQKRFVIKEKELQVKIQYEEFELQEMKIAMQYRMKEVKNWISIQNELLSQMKNQKMDDNQIWDKETGEIEDMFFMFLTNLKGIEKSTDGGEVNNLLALAKFGIDQAKSKGIYNKLVECCNNQQINAINLVENLFKKNN